MKCSKHCRCSCARVLCRLLSERAIVCCKDCAPVFHCAPAAGYYLHSVISITVNTQLFADKPVRRSNAQHNAREAVKQTAAVAAHSVVHCVSGRHHQIKPPVRGRLSLAITTHVHARLDDTSSIGYTHTYRDIVHGAFDQLAVPYARRPCRALILLSDDDDKEAAVRLSSMHRALFFDNRYTRNLSIQCILYAVRTHAQ